MIAPAPFQRGQRRTARPTPTPQGEQHEAELANAVAYFNMDVAVSGPKFGASTPICARMTAEV